MAELKTETGQEVREALDSKKTSPQQLIRTMRSDSAEAIKQQNETSVSIALAEQQKHERERREALAEKQSSQETASVAPRRIGRWAMMFIIIFLIALSILAYMFVLPKLTAVQLPKISIPLPSISLPSFSKFFSNDTASSTPTVAPLAQSMLHAQSEKRFDISMLPAQQITIEISAEKQLGLASGMIKNLYFTETTENGVGEISSMRLLAFMNTGTPNMLIRTLDKQFMAGFIGETDGTTTPFLILKISDHALGIAGMLEWEARLSQAFDNIFGTNYSLNDTNQDFHDITLDKKDVRSFSASSGVSILYVFANENTIVIAGSRSATEELLSLVEKI